MNIVTFISIQLLTEVLAVVKHGLEGGINKWEDKNDKI